MSLSSSPAVADPREEGTPADELEMSLFCSFFYADERTAEGGPVVPKPHGDGHAEVYLSLTQDDEGPSYFTFVGGKYREFP